MNENINDVPFHGSSCSISCWGLRGVLHVLMEREIAPLMAVSLSWMCTFHKVLLTWSGLDSVSPTIVI